MPNALPVTIAAYDASNNLLESFTLSAGDVNLVTPNSFYGFLDASADISSFVLTDGYVGVISGLNGGDHHCGGVPEPADLGADAGRRRRPRRGPARPSPDVRLGRLKPNQTVYCDNQNAVDRKVGGVFLGLEIEGRRHAEVRILWKLYSRAPSPRAILYARQALNHAPHSRKWSCSHGTSSSSG